MNMIIIVFTLILLISIRKSKRDFISKEDCLTVRGVMSFIIIFGHLAQRTGGGKLFSQSLKLSAICVGIYFFMSGYGLMEQYAKRGASYLETFVQRRVGELFLRYTLISLIYLIIRNVIIGDNYDWFTGITQGRPIIYFSWYILELLLLYMVFYMSGKVLTEKYKQFIWVITGCLIILLNVLFSQIGYGEYWYNSNLCFAIGIYISVYKEEIEIMLKEVNVVAILIIMVVLGIMCFKIHSVWGTQVKCVVGIVALLILLEKIQVIGRLWIFCGKMSLELYLWQGLFMYGLRSNIVYIESDVFYSLITIIGTIFIAVISNYIWTKSIIFAQYALGKHR